MLRSNRASASSEQYGDATLTRTKAPSFLELCTLLMSSAFWRLVAATFGNTRNFDAVLHARGYIPLAAEAAIGAIPVGGATEGVPVALRG